MSTIGTSLRLVSAVAALAPTLVDSIVRNRDDVVGALVSLPSDPRGVVPRMMASGLEGMGERLLEQWLDLVDDPVTRQDLVALGAVSSGATQSLQPLIESLQRQIVDPISSVLGVPDARVRASALASTLVGLTAMRSVLGVEPLASATREQIVAVFAPAVQVLLSPARP